MEQISGTKPAEMHRRTIELADGRYMIFYTFGGGASPEPADEAGPAEGGGQTGKAENV
jgi:hypothetical protein